MSSGIFRSKSKKIVMPRGVFAAPPTSVNPDLSINISGTARHCSWLLANGCDGLAILGTTGEANSFPVEQRMELIEVALAAGVPSSVLWPGTGSCSLKDTIKLTQHACKLGVAGVLVLPPFFYRNISDQAVVDWYSRLIDKVAHPGLSLILYHYPEMTGVSFTPDIISALLDRYPNVVTGIKDSSGDIDNILLYLRDFPDLSIMVGDERLLLTALGHGGAGCISASANISCKLIQELWTAYGSEERDEKYCQELQKKISHIRDILTSYPLPASIKAILDHLFGDGSWQYFMPPLLPLNDQYKEVLIDRMAPFFDLL